MKRNKNAKMVLDLIEDYKETFTKLKEYDDMPEKTIAQQRKECPIYSGFLMYFPLAVRAVAELSFKANEQHNPGTKMHWDRSKSGDEHDALMRHLMDAGTIDTDGQLHSTKVAWRAMAALEKELENAEQKTQSN